ncbi:MAG: hypothetical protein ACTSP4_05305 [Candidatus Hodarchaeales archaeon]
MPIYISSSDSYSSFLLLSKEDLANIHERFDGYEVTEDSENFIIYMDNEDIR